MFIPGLDCYIQIAGQERLGKTSNLYIVGNKAKGRISKRVFQENKAPNFSKTKRQYLLIKFFFLQVNNEVVFILTTTLFSGDK